MKDVAFQAKDEWIGMPEFDQQDKRAFRSIVLHFHDQAGVDKFSKITEQKITEKTKYLWYPEIIIEKAFDKKYENKKP